MWLKPIYYTAQFNAHVIPLLLVLPLVASAIKRSVCDGRMRLVGVLAVLTAGGTLAAFAPPLAFPRYTIALVPLMLCGLTLLIGNFADRFGRPALVATVMGVFVVSGVPHKLSHDVARATGRALGLAERMQFHPAEPWRPAIVDLLAELREPPDGPVAAVVTHLLGYAEPGETVLTTYNVPGLRFHTGLTTYGGLTCALPERPPDWIWLREPWKTHRLTAVIYDWIAANVDLADYEVITIDVPDRRFENREDIHAHIFRNPGPDAPPVRLLRRRQDTGPPRR
jgi:hypothetical protein